MPAYFDDGDINVELGEDCLATASATRLTVRQAPPGVAASIMAAGGGAQTIVQAGYRLRASLGDAEQYAHALLSSLGTSSPGELGVEDGRGYQQIWADALCRTATAVVHARRHVELEVEWVAPERPSQPSWSGVPAPPGDYGGTTAQDYAAGGTTLGIPVSMTMEMTRDVQVRYLPRCRGARVDIPQAGARMRLGVQCHAKVDADHLGSYLEDLARDVGAQELDLTGNGHTYSDCVLQELVPEHGQARDASFEAVFLQEL